MANRNKAVIDTTHFRSPKGGYYWSIADWHESIKTLISELKDYNERQFYLGLLEDMIITMPSNLKHLYTKVLRKRLGEIEHVTQN